MRNLFRRSVTLVVLVSFMITNSIQFVGAQSAVLLPEPGLMMELSRQYTPALLSGIKVYVDDPLRFDFILSGGESVLMDGGLKAETNRLIRYFLASLTVPEKDMWVNLSPYEKDRIITDEFGQTEMGRDLLAQDYLLKQLTASVICPEKETGKSFWKNVYARVFEKYGTTDVPVDTFNKVWIVPETAVVFEKNAGVDIEGKFVGDVAAYVTQAGLKVLLEQDYMARPDSTVKVFESLNDEHSTKTADFARDVMREIVVPVLEKEVNEGDRFSKLRQVYHSLILAAWYKRKVKESLLSAIYVNRKKVAGVNIDDPRESEKIWAQYVRSFKQGVYNIIREEKDELSDELIPRKYFSGGVVMNPAVQVTNDAGQVPRNNQNTFFVQAKIESSDKGQNTPDMQSLKDRLSKMVGPAKVDTVMRVLMGGPVAGRDFFVSLLENLFDSYKEDIEAFNKIFGQISQSYSMDGYQSFLVVWKVLLERNVLKEKILPTMKIFGIFEFGMTSIRTYVEGLSDDTFNDGLEKMIRLMISLNRLEHDSVWNHSNFLTFFNNSIDVLDTGLLDTVDISNRRYKEEKGLKVDVQSAFFAFIGIRQRFMKESSEVTYRSFMGFVYKIFSHEFYAQLPMKYEDKSTTSLGIWSLSTVIMKLNDGANVERLKRNLKEYSQIFEKVRERSFPVWDKFIKALFSTEKGSTQAVWKFVANHLTISDVVDGRRQWEKVRGLIRGKQSHRLNLNYAARLLYSLGAIVNEEMAREIKNFILDSEDFLSGIATTPAGQLLIASALRTVAIGDPASYDPRASVTVTVNNVDILREAGAAYRRTKVKKGMFEEQYVRRAGERIKAYRSGKLGSSSSVQESWEIAIAKEVVKQVDDGILFRIFSNSGTLYRAVASEALINYLTMGLQRKSSSFNQTFFAIAPEKAFGNNVIARNRASDKDAQGYGMNDDKTFFAFFPTERLNSFPNDRDERRDPFFLSRKIAS